MEKEELEKNYILYEDGRIFSKLKNKWLKGHINNKGYVYADLRINGKRFVESFQRLIYTYFNGEIPDGMQVNHIDENKQNNALSNLNLMTPKENVNWGSGTKRAHEKTINHPNMSKKIIAYNDDGEIVYEFESMQESQRHGFCEAHISACCNGKRKTHKDLHWRYA